MVRSALTKITADTFLTSHEIGSLLQFNPSSVNKWVAEGRIHAHRTPGGHRRVKASDLVTFLNQHGMPIPARLAGVTTTPTTPHAPKGAKKR